MIPRFGFMLGLACLSSLAAAPWQSWRDQKPAGWHTANHHRLVVRVAVPAGVPVLLETDVLPGLNPDSVRVYAKEGAVPIPAKIEWRNPTLRVSWLAGQARDYHVYFDEGGSGETARPLEPAMIGTGERISYGRREVRGELAVGLHPHPAAIDWDQDGVTDLVVSSPDKPYNGIYLFRNIGTNREPLFDRAEWLGPGKRDIVIDDLNGDGAPDLVTRGGYFSDIRRNRLARWIPLTLPRDHHVGRDDLWVPVDWDGDGVKDLLTGVADWRDYGWDDAYNNKGEWTNGPVHGYVFFHRNLGTNAAPDYAPPVPVTAGGRRIDLRGTPAPQPVDWFGRGRLDLLGGDFVDTITIFESLSDGRPPKLAAGRKVAVAGKPIRMPLCMLQPRIADWYQDGRPHLLVAEEDGRVAWFENLAARGEEVRLAAPRYFTQIDPLLKSGVLSRPEGVDWNGDGKLDLLAGNSAGQIQFFENTGTAGQPVFTDRGFLKAGGEEIRIMAGPNGSIQGPIEEKWGYSVVSAADWDGDGLTDLMLNSIWGEVLWYRNGGSRTAPVLEPSRQVEVEWSGAPPKPEWVWWEPKGKQLVTQWRTTPKMFDWNRDGLMDLVMLDHEGYLAWFERARHGSQLRLLPPRRIFVDEAGKPLLLSNGRAGKSGRRNIDLVDWDRDGDPDLIVDTDTAAWYENVGTAQQPAFRYRGDLTSRKTAGHSPCPDAADWNGDGLPDLVIGAEDGFFYFFDYRFLTAGAGAMARVVSTN